MTDMSKNFSYWKDEIALAKEFCASEGLELVISEAPYQLAKIKGSDVCIVAYPHKTSAFNYHLRLRNENSKNKDKAIELIKKLDELAGSNCTFQMKTPCR
jgi:hypothetical protein